MPLSAATQLALAYALGPGQAAAVSEISNILADPSFDAGNAVFTGTGNYVAPAGSKAVVINKGTGAATQVTLPVPTLWQTFLVVDGKGDSNTNLITIIPDGVTATTINGGASALIGTPYGALLFVYNGTQWNLAGDADETLLDMMLEISQDGAVAASGGQAGALQITGQTVRFATVAAGNGAKLPPPQPGLEVFVINHGANPLTVYGNGTENIDDVGGATGVTVMQGGQVIFACPSVSSGWYTNGLGTGVALGAAGNFETNSYTDGITALHPGAQTGVLLTTLINRLSTVASTGDSALLPVSKPGLAIVVINDGASQAAVYPQSGDTINALAANATFPVGPGQVVTFYCTTAGAWQSSPAQIVLPSKFTLQASAGPLVAAAGELTGANQVYLQLSGVSGSTYTTRSFAQMVADAGLKTGQSYMVRVGVTSGGTATLTAGANVTVTGHAAILTATWVDYVVTVGASSITFQSVGAGDMP